MVMAFFTGSRFLRRYGAPGAIAIAMRSIVTFNTLRLQRLRLLTTLDVSIRPARRW